MAMNRRSFLQNAMATVAMGTLVDFAKAEFAPEHPWEKTIFNPSNGPIALLEDFQQSAGKSDKNIHGILLCKSWTVANKVFDRIMWHTDGLADLGKRSFVWPDGDTDTVPITGDTLIVRAMRSPGDYWCYHGMAYQWIGFESITDWPTKECYNRMRATLRWHATFRPPEGLLRMRSTYYD